MEKSEQVGPYRLVRRLGAGGMGVVDEAVHAHSRARVALKRLTPEAAADPELRQRFVREARALASLDHPHVARVHAAELEGPVPYLALPLLPGGSLADRLRDGPLPLAEARRVFLELVAGLAHAHERGLLHRDLKPENVLFDEQGRAVLVDFGLARRSGEASLTASGTVMGTPAWMAPEQARDSKEVDARADVYGLGALLYGMLTGRPPFQADGRGLLALLARLQSEPPRPVLELRPDAPADLVAVCARALEKDPARRWPDARALREELRATPAPRAGARPLALALGLGGALALLGAAALSTLRAAPEEAAPDPPPPHVPPAGDRPGDDPRPDPARPDPTRTDLPRPGYLPLRVVPLVASPRGRPRACFDGRDVLVWDGEALRRCPRDVRETPLSLPPAGLPVAGAGEPVYFLARAGEALFVGIGGPHGRVSVWRGREEGPPLSCEPDAAARSARWLAVLDHQGGGRVHIVDGTGAVPTASFACPYPRSGVFSPDGRSLLVGGQTAIPGTGEAVWRKGVLARFELVDEGWTLAWSQEVEQGIRCLDLDLDRDLLAVGDETRRLRELCLSAPDLDAPDRSYVLDRAGLMEQAHDGALRGVAYLQGGRLLLSVAEVSGDGPDVELAAWDAATGRCLERLPGLGGFTGQGLICSPERDQALLCTDRQVFLITPQGQGPPARPRSWRAVPLLSRPGRLPQACFAGEEVLVWTGRGFARCPRGAARAPQELDPWPEAPPGVQAEAVSFLARTEDALFLGISGPPAQVRAWRGGAEQPPLAWRADSAVQAGRWLAVLDHQEGGRVHLIDTGGASETATFRCPFPRSAAFKPGLRELVVGGQVAEPRRGQAGREPGVLLHLVRAGPGWAAAGGPRQVLQAVRGVAWLPGRDRVVVGDSVANLSEVSLSAPDQPPSGRYLLDSAGLTSQAHQGAIRGLAFLPRARVLLSLAECNRPDPEAELAVWDPETRGCLQRIAGLPGEVAGGLVRAHDRDQALFCTATQVYLVTPDEGE